MYFRNELVTRRHSRGIISIINPDDSGFKRKSKQSSRSSYSIIEVACTLTVLLNQQTEQTLIVMGLNSYVTTDNRSYNSCSARYSLQLVLRRILIIVTIVDIIRCPR